MRPRSRWGAVLGSAMLGGLAGAPEAPAASFDWAGGFGLGVDGAVTAAVVFNDGTGDALYAGGFFTTAGGVPANRIAKWNGTSWAPLGGGMDSNIHALAGFDDGSGPALYAGGTFTTAGGRPSSNIAKWAAVGP